MSAQDYKINRASWRAGPWDDEPEDRWEGRAHGLPVLAVRSDLGNWCGYIGIPQAHAWRAKTSPGDELDELFHGGVTYCAPCQEGGPVCHLPAPGEDDDVLWFGFDCAHAGDLVPSLRPFYGRDTYRSLAWVRSELDRIAAVAAAELPADQAALVNQAVQAADG